MAGRYGPRSSDLVAFEHPQAANPFPPEERLRYFHNQHHYGRRLLDSFAHIETRDLLTPYPRPSPFRGTRSYALPDPSIRRMGLRDGGNEYNIERSF